MIKYINKSFKNKVIAITLLMIFVWSCIGENKGVIEDLGVPIGVGYDLVRKSEYDIFYRIPIATYMVDSSGIITSEILIGEAKNIGETRDNRQLKFEKRFLLGLEKVNIISEDYAKYGIKNILDILVNNPNINDKALMVICKGNAEDILKYKIEGYSSSAEYIGDLIQNLKYYNFFSDEYDFINVITRVDAEGRNVVLPYIELKENGLEITGEAIFKGDTMVAKVDLPEAKIINMLKKDNVTGILTIKKNGKEYINYETKSKRKISCYKDGEKYKFTINLTLTGTIASNELYKNLSKDPKELKKFTLEMEKHTKKMCEDFINRAKYQHKVDFLGLGKFAAAKYGRHSGVDWNKVVNESDVYVNVKVKVDTQGRGDY